MEPIMRAPSSNVASSRAFCRRITLRVERGLDLVSIGLAGEREILDASRETFELRRIVKIRIEAGGKIVCARDGKNRRAGDMFYAGLDGRSISMCCRDIDQINQSFYHWPRLS